MFSDLAKPSFLGFFSFRSFTSNGEEQAALQEKKSIFFISKIPFQSLLTHLFICLFGDSVKFTFFNNHIEALKLSMEALN